MQIPMLNTPRAPGKQGRSSHTCVNPDVLYEPRCSFAGIVAVPTLQLPIKSPFKPIHQHSWVFIQWNFNRRMIQTILVTFCPSCNNAAQILMSNLWDTICHTVSKCQTAFASPCPCSLNTENYKKHALIKTKVHTHPLWHENDYQKCFHIAAALPGLWRLKSISKKIKFMVLESAHLPGESPLPCHQ